ncbi:(2Fe-2S)-binding protein [Propioniciclava flava]|uniref:Uncharacterized protein n=1 Tax=Propioniciclava flava TaxID=2072026 RepID=A0A4V1Q762_9ACTN|nr:(2Fe-2S)-binding protein [Propioniciclava flava]RXW31478.1 hypothetical protein C1706_11395 [Propioniciclava flava]
MMPAASPAAATTLHTILDRLSDAERPFFLLGEDASPVNAEAIMDGDGVEELGATLDAVIGVLASRLGRGERRLWALAVDSLTNRLLWLGAATGQLGRAQAMAVDLVAALDRPGVPAPRFTTLRDLPEGVRDVWVRRGSCCLVSRVPGHGSCADCPRQTPAEREARLRERALTGGDH